MAATLARHKASSFVIGCATGLAVVVSTRALIWRQTTEIAEVLPEAVQARWRPEKKDRDGNVLLLGPETRAYMVRQWNQMVDAAATPVIEALIDRGL